jgi:hypothetical protein
MSLFKKTVGLMVIISILSLHFPEIIFAMQKNSSVASDNALGITKHDPEFLAPPEVEIPVETTIEEKKVEKRKTNKWVWIGLGVLATGVIVAALGGGGGGGGGGDGEESGPPPPSSGTVTIRWNKK